MTFNFPMFTLTQVIEYSGPAESIATIATWKNPAPGILKEMRFIGIKKTKDDKDSGKGKK